MKADALKKLYIDIHDNLTNSILYDFTEKSKDSDIEYVRKDAFIEKAVEWLSRHFYDECYQFYDNDGMWIDADSMIEDFKNYMKGE